MTNNGDQEAEHTEATANPSHELTTWGVGPWQGAWPAGAGTPEDETGFDPDSPWDRELLAQGDSRNVVDKYRYWRMDAIVADLDRKRHGFHVAIENWQHDLNIGSIVRSANAFLASEVHIIGNRRWNRRGAMVTDRYQHVRHHPSIEDFVSWAATAGPKGEPLPILAIDNVPGCRPIERESLPEHCVFLFGQEGPGLSQPAIDAAASVLEITQYGSTRSMNASAAAAITMYSWVLQHGPLAKP